MIELCESAQKINVSNFSVKILIFEADNKTDLLGLDLNGWLNVATINFNKQFISSNNNHEEQIIKNLDNSDITVVLHAFNPLITENNISFYIDYLVYKNLDLVKLPFGYVFKTNYIKQTKSFKEPIVFNGIDNEFLKVDSSEAFNVAYQILKNRIIQKHINNGVKFVDVLSTVVHYFVEIDAGTQIYPFNIITGNTKIGKNAVIKDGNTIESCVIGDECVIAKSEIKKSIIQTGTIVLPFNTINNSKIEDNCLVKSYNHINDAHILSGVTVESFNNLN